MAEPTANELPAIGETAENYLRVVYQICRDSEVGIASNGDIAKRLCLSPGAVTATTKRLGRSGWVRYNAHRGVRLTPLGQQAAIQLIRRYEILKAFLTMTLGLPEEDGCAEAERLEHTVSNCLVERMAEVLVAAGAARDENALAPEY